MGNVGDECVVAPDEWQDEEGALWQFSKYDPNENLDYVEIDNAYEIVFTDKEGKSGKFAAYLVKLKDKLLLDIMPGYWQDDPNEIDYVYNTLFWLPAHTFIKVEAVEPNLILKLAMEDELEKLLKSDPNIQNHPPILPSHPPLSVT